MKITWHNLLTYGLLRYARKKRTNTIEKETYVTRVIFMNNNAITMYLVNICL